MAIASLSEIRSGRPGNLARNLEHANLLYWSALVAVNPHQLFAFFLVLLQSCMLSRLCRIPLLRENFCCARLTVSALGVLNAALRQPRNARFFRPQQCAYAMALQRVCGGLRRQRRQDLLPRGGQRFAVPLAPRGTRDGSPWRSLCPTVPTSNH
jgi:hypothetical protein